MGLRALQLLYFYDVIKLQVRLSKILAEPLIGPPKIYTNGRACCLVFTFSKQK